MSERKKFPGFLKSEAQLPPRNRALGWQLCPHTNSFYSGGMVARRCQVSPGDNTLTAEEKTTSLEVSPFQMQRIFPKGSLKETIMSHWLETGYGPIIKWTPPLGEWGILFCIPCTGGGPRKNNPGNPESSKEGGFRIEGIVG